MTGRSRPASSDTERAIAAWRRWKWLGVAVFAVAFATAAAIAKFLPDIYRSTATILIERPQVPDSFVRSAVTIDLETRLQTIREQILSRSRLWNVITTFDLYPELRNKQVPQDVVVGQMRRDVSVAMKEVESGQDTGAPIALTISYQGREPKKVAAVANALANEYVQENSKTRERQAKGTSDFLRSQLDQVQRQLQGQERKVHGYQRQFGAELPTGREAVLNTLQRLSMQLDRNIENQYRAKERLSQVERELASPLPPPPLPDGSESDEARLGRLRAQLADLRQRFTEQYPDIAALKAEIAVLEKRVGSRTGAPATATGDRPAGLNMARAANQKRQIEAELKALVDEERRLRPILGSYQARLERMPGRELELQEMSRDYASVREQYESLLKRYSDAALAERVELRSRGEEVSILDPAVASGLPIAPNRQRLLMMALVFAVGLTIAVMFAADRLDSSFHTANEVRAFTSVPVLATVPPIITRGDQARAALRAGLAMAALVLAVVAAVGGAYVIADGNEGLVMMVVRGGS